MSNKILHQTDETVSYFDPNEETLNVGDMVIFSSALHSMPFDEIVLARVKSISKSGRHIRVNSITKGVTTYGNIYANKIESQKLNALHLIERNKLVKYPLPIEDIGDLPVELLRDALGVEDFETRTRSGRIPHDFMGNALVAGDIVYRAQGNQLVLGKLLWDPWAKWTLDVPLKDSDLNDLSRMYDMPPCALVIYPFNNEKKREECRNVNTRKAIELIAGYAK
jgi:hypothetical protein